MNITDLHQALKEHGYESRVLPISVVPELESGIRDLVNKGTITADFYQKELSANIDFSSKSKLFKTRSIIILACFQPPTRVKFGSYFFTVPPTYIYRPIREDSFRILVTLLEPDGYSVRRARLPFKLLAARSGLGRYGRNNLLYIEGIGSFQRMEAFYSDLPRRYFELSEPQVMEKCKSCVLCQKACPTNAINPDRFIINAERCLTYFNENQEPFPDWIKPSCHNAIIGCLKCQQVCPANREVLPTRLPITAPGY